MAAKKWTALIEITSVDDNDITAVVDDVAGIPVSRKITIGNFAASTPFSSRYTTEAVAKVEYLLFAVSDEATALSTGTKLTFRMPFAFTLTAVRANLNTASTSGIVQVDINENGVSVLGFKISIDANEKTSTTAAQQANITDASLADDAEITIDIDTAGTGAKGLKVLLVGTRA